MPHLRYTRELKSVLRQCWSFFKRDVAYARWYISALLTVLVIRTLLDTAVSARTPDVEQILSLLDAIFVFAYLLLVCQVTQQENLVRPYEYWRSRPFHRVAMWMGKFMVALVVASTVTITDLTVVVLNGSTSAPAFLGAVGKQFQLLCWVVLPAFALASVTPTVAAFSIGAVITVVLWIVFRLIALPFPQYVRLAAGPYSWPYWLGAGILVVTGSIACIWAAHRDYLVFARLALFASIMLAFAALHSYRWYEGFALQELFGQEAPPRITIRAAGTLSVGAEPDFVRIPLQVLGVAPNEILHIEGISLGAYGHVAEPRASLASGSIIGNVSRTDLTAVTWMPGALRKLENAEQIDVVLFLALYSVVSRVPLARTEVGYRKFDSECAFVPLDVKLSCSAPYKLPSHLTIEWTSGGRARIEEVYPQRNPFPGPAIWSIGPMHYYNSARLPDGLARDSNATILRQGLKCVFKRTVSVRVTGSSSAKLKNTGPG